MMQPQILNRIAPSFVYFIDHKMLKKGNAFVNIQSGSLFSSSDPNYPNKKIYASPYRQFVADNSIAGANIPSGVFIGNSFIEKGTDGLAIDYDKGRILFNNNYASTSSVKCSFAYKEYNVYYNESQDEQLVFEAKYPVRPIDYNSDPSNNGLLYDQLTYPAIFVKTQYNENFPFAFGGLDQTQVDIRCIFLADSTYLLDAGVSIASDLARTYFPILHPKDMPFNMYGDYKNNINYNYSSLCSSYSQTGSLMALVDSVSISKFAPSVNRMIGNNSFGAFADFTIKFIRETRL